MPPLAWLDWLVVVAYLAWVVSDGIRHSRATGDVDGYLLANRSLPWWAVGLSVMATQLSAITLVGATGQGYADGMRFIQFYLGLPIAMVLLSVTAVPFFYRARVYTAYEYLERRFDVKTRVLASVLFLLSRGLACGVIISAPAVILSILFGWSTTLTVLLMGVPTILYTVLGGVQAVAWTDVKQMAVIVAGVVGAVVILLVRLPQDVSLGHALHLAGATGRLQALDFRFALGETYTFWSGLLGGLFLMLSYFGCDQSQVQRYLTARSVDGGRHSLLLSAFVKIPLQALILMTGVLVWVSYVYEPPPLVFNPVHEKAVAASGRAEEYRALERELAAAHQARLEASRATEVRGGEAAGGEAAGGAAAGGEAAGGVAAGGVAAARQVTGGEAAAREAAARERFVAADRRMIAVRKSAVALVREVSGDAAYQDVNYVFPTFVLRKMPPGLVGLLIAAIFAAAMSSIAAELNALATSSVIDIYRRLFRPAATDAETVLASRIATVLWGLFACLVATFAANLGSLIEVVNRFGSFFYGSLLGVFVLAVGFKRATSLGAFVGLLAGMSAVALVALRTHISFLWYNVVGAVTVVVVGLLLSAIFPRIGAAPATGDGRRALTARRFATGRGRCALRIHTPTPCRRGRPAPDEGTLRGLWCLLWVRGRALRPAAALPGVRTRHEGGVTMTTQRVCSDLNITPLVDIALVLLILFMAATPPAQEGYDVVIPERATPSARAPARDAPVVALAADGSLTLAGVATSLESLTASLRTRETGRGLTVLFRADEEAAYDRVIEVLDRIRVSGVVIGMVTRDAP